MKNKLLSGPGLNIGLFNDCAIAFVSKKIVWKLFRGKTIFPTLFRSLY